MHRPTRRTPLLRFLLPAALLLAACDRGDEELESPELQDERAAEAAPAADGDEPSREHAHRGKGRELERLCGKLECTDEQRVKIEGLAQRLWSERPEPAGDREAANAALAKAFGGEGFAAADLQAFHAAAGPDAGEMDALLVEAVGELHGILDASQRATLAEKIEKHGLPFVGGHKGGRKAERDGDAAHDEARAAKRLEKLCAAIACAEEQRPRLAALLQARHEPGQVPEAERGALAQSFRGDALAGETVTAYLEAAAKVRASDLAARDAQVVELHGLLTAEQRASLAARIAEDGPRALGSLLGKDHHGKGGRRGGHHDGHRDGQKGGKGRRGGPQGEAQQFG